jgi:hypothetical protein
MNAIVTMWRAVWILRKEKTVLNFVILNSSNDNRATAIFFYCHMVMLAFILINAIFWANVLLHIATIVQFIFEK